MSKKSIRILIVDDELQILEIAKAFLVTFNGFEVDVSPSSKQAIGKVQATRYDAIVSDYQMPEMDGIEFLKLLRSRGDLTPFILFTGKGREEVVIEALNSGADFYLQKGGEPKAQFAELANMIQKVVQRRRMELELIENEEKFENIFNSANDAIYIIDPKGHILEINEVGCARLGYTKKELLKRNIGEFDSEQYAKQVPDRLKEVLEKGFSLFETELVARGGRLIPSEVGSRRISYFGQPAILSVVRDVTERKMTEDALLESTDQCLHQFSTLSGIIESSAAPIFSVDKNHLYTSFNKGHAQTMREESGVGIELGKSILGYLKGDAHRAELMNNIDKALLGERIVTETRPEGKEPVDRLYEVAFNPILDSDGKVTGVAVISRDISQSKRAQLDIEAKEEKLRIALAASNEGILQWNVKTGEMAYSIEENTPLGYAKENAPSSFAKASRIVHPDDVDGFLAMIKEKSAQGLLVSVQARMRHQSGEWRWIEVNAKCIERDEENAPLIYIGTYRDVTDFKNAQNLAEENFRFFNTLLDTIPIPIFYKDKERRYKGCNAAFESFIGLPRGQMIGKSVYDISPKELADQYYSADDQLFENKAMQDYESQVREADGTLHDVIFHKAPYFDSKGEVDGFIGAIIDVTNETKKTAELRRSEETYRSLFENLTDGVVSVDLHGRIIDFNQSYEKMTGYFGAELRSISFYDITPAEWHPIESKVLEEQVMRRGFSDIYEKEYKRKDGTIFPIELRAYLIRNSLGEPSGMWAIVQDITERKRKEKELRQMGEKLSLLSNVTRHDILNEVTIQMGYLDLIRKRTTDPEMMALIEKVRSATLTIRSQVEFTKVYQGTGVLAPKWQDLSAIINSLMIPKGVAVSLSCLEVEVLADPMLSLVFSNMLDNLIRHGEHVTSLKVSCSRSDAGLSIVWEDNGVGVGEKSKELIFTRGFGKNTGMGLFLIRQILSITGITIVENGIEGKGARFEISVPVGAFRINEQTNATGQKSKSRAMKSSGSSRHR